MIDPQRPSSHHNATQATSLRESKLNTLGNTHASLYTPWGSAWRVSLVTFAVLGIFAMVGGILFYAHQASEQNQTGAVVVTTTQTQNSSANNSSSDVVLTAWQCSSSRKLVFRASNGWDRNSAIEVARSESCARWE